MNVPKFPAFQRKCIRSLRPNLRFNDNGPGTIVEATFMFGLTQSAFTCLKLTTETLEQGVALLVSLLLTFNIFHTLL